MLDIIEKKLLTEKEVSEMTTLKPNTLAHKRSAGLPPRYIKMGSKVLYKYEDVIEYINSNIVEPTCKE